MLLHNSHKVLKRSLLCCLAILTLATVTAPSAVMANKHPKVTSKTKKVVPKAPWKKAWNQYAEAESGYASVYLYPVAKQIPSKKWYSHIDQRINIANHKHAGTIKGWNKFFADHQQKGAFRNDIVTYPAYRQISDASFNALHEKKNQSWFVTVPYSDTVGLGAGHPAKRSSAVESDYKRALMISNSPMKDLTQNQESVLTNWAEPVHNNQRLLTSFHNWMKEYNNAPQITVANKTSNTHYTYNNSRNFFTATEGQNGYGITYAYNPDTGHYQRISNATAVKQLTYRSENLNDVITQYLQAVARADQHNPILDRNSRKIVARFASQPGTSQADAYRKAIQFCSTSQGKQLIYSADKAADAERKSKEISTDKDLDHVSELLALQSTPAFQKVPAYEVAATGRYLLYHPAILNYLVRRYHAYINGDAVTTDTKATNVAKQANQFADTLTPSQKKDSPKGYITSNPAVVRQMSMINELSKVLASRQGLQNVIHAFQSVK